MTMKFTFEVNSGHDVDLAIAALAGVRAGFERIAERMVPDPRADKPCARPEPEEEKTANREGPFYWAHPESDSYGEAEDEAVWAELPKDAVEISEADYQKLVKRDVARAEKEAEEKEKAEKPEKTKAKKPAAKKKAEPEPEEKDEKTAEVTQEAVREALMAVCQAKNPEEAFKVLNTFDSARSIGDVDKAKWPALLEKLTAAAEA